jgi:hypothetical protein
VVRLVDQLLMQLLPVGDILHQNETALPPLEVDKMRCHVHLDIRAIFAPMTPGAGQFGGVGHRIFQENGFHIFGGAQIRERHADKFFA